MRDLETLNRHPGTATNAMCTFLAINTGSVQLISVNAIAVLAAAQAATAVKAVIGAGTGMGQCFLTHNGANYDVWPSEGGHGDFAARSKLEFAISELAQKEDG